MKVLITGAFGFVGTNLSAYLTPKGFDLWALDVDSVGKGQSIGREGTSRKDAEMQGDYYARRFNWKELEKIPWDEVDAVIHLAGKAHDMRNVSNPQSYFDVNVCLTTKVLEAWKTGISHRSAPIISCQDAKTQREEREGIPVSPYSRIPTLKFIFFSSVKAVADRVEGVLTEEAVPDPKTPYGQSKLEAEREVLKCGSSEIGEAETANGTDQTGVKNSRTLELLNFNTYILRPCMIHGPGNKGNLNLLYGVVRMGLPWPLGTFENQRTFTSIDNLCAVIDGLLTGDVASGVYQMADDEALSINELIGLMAESLGRQIKIWRIPETWIRAVARIGDVFKLPLNSERLKKLTESYVASNAKLKAALGWTEMPVRARDGMRKTIEGFRK